MNKQLLGAFLVSMLVACGGTPDPELEATPNESSQEEVRAETPEVERDAQIIALCSPYYYEILYYSDCTRDTVVGIESVTCKGAEASPHMRPKTSRKRGCWQTS